MTNEQLQRELKAEQEWHELIEKAEHGLCRGILKSDGELSDKRSTAVDALYALRMCQGRRVDDLKRAVALVEKEAIA